MEFCILGRVAVVANGREHVLAAGKEAALLADLLVHAGQVVPADRLIEDLWRGAAPPGAMATLQTYVKNLRRVLEPDRRPGSPSAVLITRRPGYMLVVDADGVDASRFERLVREGRASLGADDDAKASELFTSALALWSGPAFGELSDESYLKSETARLEDVRVGAIEDRINADLRLGRHGEVCGELEALVGRYPYREQLWSYFMLALYRSGRQADSAASVPAHAPAVRRGTRYRAGRGGAETRPGNPASRTRPRLASVA